MREDITSIIMEIITKETLFGLPTIVSMFGVFIIGLIIGILFRKALKWGIVLVIIAGVGLYFGVVSWGFIGRVANYLMDYGSKAIQYAAVVCGVLPLGLGLVVGLIIGIMRG